MMAHSRPYWASEVIDATPRPRERLKHGVNLRSYAAVLGDGLSIGANLMVAKPRLAIFCADSLRRVYAYLVHGGTIMSTASTVSAFGDTRSTWLSDFVELARKHHHFRLFQIREFLRLLATDPRGRAILNHPDSIAAFHAGFDAADEREHELEQNPTMTASPSHEAARVIAERLGITL